MRRLGITQRVENILGYGERRDCLDQRWAVLAIELGFIPIPLSNVDPTYVSDILDSLRLDGIILSGGNSIARLESATDAAPERDAFEVVLIDEGVKRSIPILGVCRGMQVINLYYGGKLSKVKDHVATYHDLKVEPSYSKIILDSVNSYHNWAIKLPELASCLTPLALDEQDNIECFIHKEKAVAGIMWHPEREVPFKQQDIDLIKKFLL